MPDPKPRWIPPMLAKLSGALPPDDDRWAYEMKWDGIRGLAFVEAGTLKLLTRNQIEVTRRYPELAGIGPALAGRRAILDGEIVGFDGQGRPRFEALQQRMGLDGNHRIPARRDVPVAYMIFDALYLDDAALLNQPYEARREQLGVLHLEGSHWQTPPVSIGGGEGLEASREQGMEVVAKRLGSRYESGKRTVLACRELDEPTAVDVLLELVMVLRRPTQINPESLDAERCPAYSRHQFASLAEPYKA